MKSPTYISSIDGSSSTIVAPTTLVDPLPGLLFLHCHVRLSSTILGDYFSFLMVLVAFSMGTTSVKESVAFLDGYDLSHLFGAVVFLMKCIFQVFRYVPIASIIIHLFGLGQCWKVKTVERDALL